MIRLAKAHVPNGYRPTQAHPQSERLGMIQSRDISPQIAIKPAYCECLVPRAQPFRRRYLIFGFNRTCSPAAEIRSGFGDAHCELKIRRFQKTVIIDENEHLTLCLLYSA